MSIIDVAAIALKWEFNKNKDTNFVTDMVNERDCVRAVLMSIREPSEAMVEAGDEEEYLMNVESVPAGDRWRRVWQAMIDAALAE